MMMNITRIIQTLNKEKYKMTTDIMKIGSFGLLKAGKEGYKKTIHCWIREKDKEGNVFVMDTDGIFYVFKPSQIDEWIEKEFTPLPDKYYWDSGKIYNKGTKKEADLKK